MNCIHCGARMWHDSEGKLRISNERDPDCRCEMEHDTNEEEARDDNGERVL